MQNNDLFKRFAEVGVHAPYAVGLMPFTERNGVITTDYSAAAQSLAQDAAMSTQPNTGVPVAFTTYLDPEVTTILFAATNATKLFNEAQKGDWTTTFAQFPVEEMTGRVTSYSDFTNSVSSDVNYEFPSRENYVFETVIKYGLREADVAAKARLSYAGGKQKSAANTIARAHNSFALLGVRGKQSYGALNDPNIPASITPISINEKSTWEDKSQDPANAPIMANIFYNDLAKLLNTLISRNKGQVDSSSTFTLAIASDRVSYLTWPNQFGKTALQLLKENYPNLTVLQLPELETNAGSMLYLVAQNVGGEKTAELAYSDKMRLLQMVPDVSSFRQKAVGGTYGCIVRRPTLIATMAGI